MKTWECGYHNVLDAATRCLQWQRRKGGRRVRGALEMRIREAGSVDSQSRWMATPPLYLKVDLEGGREAANTRLVEWKILEELGQQMLSRDDGGK